MSVFPKAALFIDLPHYVVLSFNYTFIRRLGRIVCRDFCPFMDSIMIVSPQEDTTVSKGQYKTFFFFLFFVLFYFIFFLSQDLQLDIDNLIV